VNTAGRSGKAIGSRPNTAGRSGKAIGSRPYYLHIIIRHIDFQKCFSSRTTSSVRIPDPSNGLLGVKECKKLHISPSDSLYQGRSRSRKNFWGHQYTSRVNISMSPCHSQGKVVKDSESFGGYGNVVQGLVQGPVGVSAHWIQSQLNWRPPGGTGG